MATMTDADITQQMATLDGWTQVDQTIPKHFTFVDFPEAVLLVSALVPADDSPY